MRLNLSGHLTDHTTFCYTGGRRLEAQRPTALFIHGAAHDHSVWTLQARHFASHGWNVIAPDLPGHGRSAGPALESVEAAAHWILALVDKLGCEAVTLIGHSLGSLIALQAAADGPARVTRLALLGSVAPMPVAAPLLEAAITHPDRAHGMINQWSYTPRSQLGASAIPGLNLTALNERLMQRQAAGVLHQDLTACNAYQGGLEAASRIRCPTLLLCAALDRMTPPRASEALAKAFPATTPLRRATVADAGHAMMVEAPGAVLDALWNFVLSPPSPG